MGWGIDFTPDVFLSKMSFMSQEDLEDEIEEINQEIQNIRTKINMFIAATPSDVFIGNETIDNNIDGLHRESDILFEWYNETFYKKIKLDMFLEYVKEQENYDFSKKE